MRAPAQTLADFLLADIRATGSTTFAQELLDNAKAKIAAGKGEVSMLASGSLNGQSFARLDGLQLNLTALDVAGAARHAIDTYEDGEISSTSLDFSQLFC
ncbi:MAG TPA: hypothetical protein VF614_16375 [Chthoniobacteraceae bacterium]|jgi:hypothetical protein